MDLLDEILQKALTSKLLADGQITLVWHAGEPLIAGRKFYQQASELIRRHAPAGSSVQQAIQTNGMFIDRDWCDLFLEEGIDVNVSLDGPQYLHDRRRVDRNGQGSFEEAMNGVAVLFERGLPLRATCVLTEDSLNHHEDIFEFFRSTGFSSVSFNIDEVEGINRHSSLTAGETAEIELRLDRYRSFMRRLYELWVANGRPYWIREFSRTEEVLRRIALDDEFGIYNTEVSGLAIVTITKSGDISTYSPELSASPGTFDREFSIANIRDINSLDDLVDNPTLLGLAAEVNEGTIQCARECDYFGVCGGGSPSNRYFETGSLASSDTWYCTFQKKAVTDVVLSGMAEESRARVK